MKNKNSANIIPAIESHIEVGCRIIMPTILPVISLKQDGGAMKRKLMYEKLINRTVPWPKT